MRFPRHSWLTKRRGQGRHHPQGLVLVELMLFLFVLVLTATLALTALSRIRRQARLAQWGADLQSFAGVFEKIRAESGRWPETAAAVGPRLQETGWGGAPAFGGEHGWKPPQAGGLPGRITLTAFSPHFPLTLTRSDLLALDRQIDDGDLTTGRFRTGFNGWPVYLVGDKP